MTPADQNKTVDVVALRQALPTLHVKFVDGGTHEAEQWTNEQYQDAIIEAAHLWPECVRLEEIMYRAGNRMQQLRYEHDTLLARIERYERAQEAAYRARFPSAAAIRRDRRKASSEHYTKAEWSALKSFYRYTCLACGRSEPDIKLHPDHVKPLSCGGSDGIGNIQPLCESDNSRKGTKTIDYRPDISAAISAPPIGNTDAF